MNSHEQHQANTLLEFAIFDDAVITPAASAALKRNLRAFLAGEGTLPQAVAVEYQDKLKLRNQLLDQLFGLLTLPNEPPPKKAEVVAQRLRRFSRRYPRFNLMHEPDASMDEADRLIFKIRLLKVKLPNEKMLCRILSETSDKR